MAAVLWLTWSVGGALTAPGTDAIDARLAEWARTNYLGWVVDGLEKVQYALDTPQIGGSVQGGIPNDSPVAGEFNAGSSGNPAASGAPSSQPRQGSSPDATTMPTAPPTASAPPTPVPTPTPFPSPSPITPLVSPALPGEGVWQTLAVINGQPALRVAHLRPDAQHTSYLDTVVWIDQNLVKLILHPGYQLPGGSGWSQAFDVPASQRDTLVATFNSAFRLNDSNGGYWADGQTAAPLRPGAASAVFYKDGTVDIVKWGSSAPGPDVAAVRQNLVLLVDNGVVSPLVDNLHTPVWGTTWTTGYFLWRTAIGIRADGSLLFAIGPAMTVGSLARIMAAAGAVRAMQFDQNPAWTNFMTYTHPKHDVAVPHMLVDDNTPSPYRYLYPSSRDFVAVQARS
jgi:Phosphodiester glycosidase